MLGAREFVCGGETTTFIVGAGEINRLRGRLACHRGRIFIGIGGGEINNIIINRWRWRWRWRWRLRNRQHHHQNHMANGMLGGGMRNPGAALSEKVCAALSENVWKSAPK
jgi:hypothetical protein